METCLAANCEAALNGPTTNIFVTLVQTLLAAQCNLASGNIYPPDRSEEIAASNMEFDFVIVGGGTAGSVLANRLTEIEKWKVLLIEAGENPSMFSEVPGGFTMQISSDEDYSYDVEPEKLACHGGKNKLCKWSKGKALGGSSTLNAMLYIYGKEDYDEWFQMGNEGWSYDQVLPYFKKSQACGYEHSNERRSKNCGHDGPLNIRYYNYSHMEIYEMILNGARELNIPILDVINGNKLFGYGIAQGTLDKGRRMSASKSFLSPIKDRSNLYVMKSTRGDAILLDGTRAVGVRVTLKDGRSIDVKASKEVILSAGSIASPQLLMLSGIGPKQHLHEMGIPIVADLPVGKNLQDHINWLGIQLAFKNPNATQLSPTYLLDIAYEYLMYNRGPLASSIGHDITGFVNVHDLSAQYPNIQFIHSHLPQGSIHLAISFLSAFNLNEEIIQEITGILTEADMLTFLPLVTKPKSLGQLRLRSKDPADPVKIYANYFSEQEDLETMLKSLDFVKKMLNTEAFRRHGVWLRHLDIADCRHTKPDSDEYWRCNLRHMTSTTFHPTGTAKMGPRDDPTSVVSARLKVHGVQGLRVIDASIMPTITIANTNAPTIMIGEKGADLIKEDWVAEGKDEL